MSTPILHRMRSVFAHDECLERMRVVLDRLGRRTRPVFLLHRLYGLSYAQIAQNLGLSVSSIEKHFASALAAAGGNRRHGHQALCITIICPPSPPRSISGTRSKR